MIPNTSLTNSGGELRFVSRPRADESTGSSSISINDWPSFALYDAVSLRKTEPSRLGYTSARWETYEFHQPTDSFFKNDHELWLAITGAQPFASPFVVYISLTAEALPAPSLRKVMPLARPLPADATWDALTRLITDMPAILLAPESEVEEWFQMIPEEAPGVATYEAMEDLLRRTPLVHHSTRHHVAELLGAGMAPMMMPNPEVPMFTATEQ